MTFPDSGDMETTKKGWMRALLLAAFVVLVFYLFRFTGLKQYVTTRALGDFLRRAGWWAPAAYMSIYTIGTTLFLPAVVLTGVGAVVFGAYWGFVYAWAGAMGGAALSFFIGRTLGRDFIASRIGEKLRKYDAAIEQSGFKTVLFVRLVYSPFAPASYGMGLTRVRFSEYMLGTGLGISLETFIFTFFIDTVKGAWISGHWEKLISWKTLVVVVLFGLSLLAAHLARQKKPD